MTMKLINKWSPAVILLSVFIAASGCSSPDSVRTTEAEGTAGSSPAIAVSTVTRPLLIAPEELLPAVSAAVSVPDYSLEEDFSNVLNRELCERLPYEIQEDLKKNYFAVGTGSGYEFFEVYENNTYNYVPSFITVDSLLHTFHLYYAYLQKNIEKQFLLDALCSMSEKLLDESMAQYNTLKGTAFEEAAQRNIDYFTLAVVLSGGDAVLSDTASAELAMINDASALGTSVLFSTEETDYTQDYSQFKPRGYYTENEDLESYFRTMMWYGQMNFTQRDAELDRSAMLAALAIHNAGLQEWETIYKVTAFLAGESDDNGYYEYYPVITAVYGETPDLSEIGQSEEQFETYHSMTAELGTPQINSMVIGDEDAEPDRNSAVTGFRIMGQRFSVDAAILQKLVYRDVAENAAGNRRMLPDALDVPAALGSKEALKILNASTDVSEYPDYEVNLQEIQESVAAAGDELWASSVSSAWLNTLRPLLNEERTGYPMFMKNTAWTHKNLITFLGNYTELKHDTVLYAKQTMAEMGADGIIPVDDRGYVEPEPEVFARLKALAEATVNGLDQNGMISEEDKDYMGILAELTGKLQIISEKELRNELPSDEEFDLIRAYGGTLEHLWLRTVMTEGHDDKYLTMDYPAALITDIATDPNQERCLEIACGNPDTIYVLVNFDGAIRLAKGSVYEFYQIEQPLSDRLTDEEWRDIIKTADYYAGTEVPALPDWIADYASYLLMMREPQVGYCNVIISNLNIRSAPNTKADTVGTANETNSFNVFETVDSGGYTWYRIGHDRWIADDGGKWVRYYER